MHQSTEVEVFVPKLSPELTVVRHAAVTEGSISNPDRIKPLRSDGRDRCVSVVDLASGKCVPFDRRAVSSGRILPRVGWEGPLIRHLLVVHLAVAATVVATPQAQCETPLQTTRAKAAAGDVEAMFQLATELRRDTSEEGRAERLDWYRKAAELGHTESQVMLGSDYAHGVFAPLDAVAAAKWYGMAAKNGHAEAQYYMGVAHHLGKGVREDPVEAAKWYMKAAEQGYASAQFMLGWVYAHGHGVEKDPATSLVWWRKAAAAAKFGWAGAGFNIGVAYATGAGVPKDPAEAARWYPDEVSSGVQLGALYLGFDEACDTNVAVWWYGDAAEQGNSLAQCLLAEAYVSDWPWASKDAAKAMYWYRKAAEQGSAWAQEVLGDAYHDGEWVSQDFAASLGWWRKAADQGRASAQYRLGQAYADGEGLAKDLAKALFWWRKAAEQGHDSAQIAVGNAYYYGQGVAKNLAESVKWYRKAAEGYSIDGWFNLGFAYANGQGVSKDAGEAVRWYRQAAESGHTQAQLHLGLAYATGEGVGKDPVEAVKWYREAADQSDATAEYMLGLAYARGEGVAKDAAQAARWYLKAAEQGESGAQFELGRAYSGGSGVVRDRAESVRWYRMAAEQGEAAAQFNLAVAYASGKGVLTSGAAAADWYYRAGLSYLEKGQTDDALTCVGRIQDLQKVLRLTVPNMHLADQLLKQIYPPNDSRTTAPPASDRGTTERPKVGRPAPQAVSGTAWVLDATHLVTNYHVIEGHTSIAVVFPVGHRFRATVETSDKVNDLAVLRVDGPVRLPPPLPLATAVPKVGTDVFTIGYPHPDLMGHAPKLTNGIISSTTGTADDIRLFQITVPLQSGNSGGPLLNMQGEVVGVVVAKLNAAEVFKWTGDLPENVNYAVKIDYLRAMTRSDVHAGTGAAYARTADLEAIAARVMPSVALVVAEGQ